MTAGRFSSVLTLPSTANRAAPSAPVAALKDERARRRRVLLAAAAARPDVAPVLLPVFGPNFVNHDLQPAVVDAVDAERAPDRGVEHDEALALREEARLGGRDFEVELVLARERLAEDVFDGAVERDRVGRVAALVAFDLYRVVDEPDFRAGDFGRDLDLRRAEALRVGRVAERQ